MDCIETIKELSGKIPRLLEKRSLETEEAAKQALVLPFINSLGYDIFNTAEVVPEFTCDFLEKKGKKVDYAIMKDKKPIMLIECKSVNDSLKDKDAAQLFGYFSVTEAKVGVLTNGIVYKFYSDLDKENKMDEKPFLELNLLDIKEPLFEELKLFRKDIIDLEEIETVARKLKYTKEIKRILGDELNSPSEGFVYFFTKQVYSGKITKSVLEKFKDIIHPAFKQFISDIINERLKSALEDDGGTPERPDNPEDGKSEEDGIITTEEEIEGFYIVRAILHEITDPERATLKDTKSYCNVLLDKKVTNHICRFYFDHKQKYVGLFNENKVEEKVPIDKLSDIYNFADKLKATIGYYDTNTSAEDSPENNLNPLHEITLT